MIQFVNTPDPVSESADPDIGMNIDRVEAFSDGVFAVAVTLLILNLQPPHLQNADSPSLLIEQLLSQWPSYLSYVISFVSIGAVWITHHQMLKYARQVDAGMQTLNLLFLMFITLTPFTTSLLAQYIQQPDKLRIALVIYGGTWEGNGICFAGLWAYMRRMKLLKPTVSPDLIRKMTLSATMGTIGGSLGILFALIAPPVSFFIFIAITVAYLILPFRQLFRKGKA